jgi:hypothetical protein
MEETEMGGDGDGGGDGHAFGFQENRNIDILLVVDNSGSMGPTQAKLSAALDELVTVLEDPRVDANYRIAVTSTDNGLDGWCDASTIDAGRLLLSSCLDRPGEFEGDAGDAFELACSDLCSLTNEELEILPTATHRSDGQMAVRPWLERLEGQRNLPDTVSTLDALRCIVPQGVDGCGFESPLESQYLAFERSGTPGDPAEGFHRPFARLAILHLTDEADCSVNPEWPVIFEEGGNQVFWSNLSLDHPTSGVCWNAGVECESNPFIEGLDCAPANKDQLGQFVEDPEDAVMRPMRRYIDQIVEKQSLVSEILLDRVTILRVIGGIDEHGGVTYSADDGPIPGFTEEYAVGPGCVTSGGEPHGAVPPVRLATLVDRFDGQGSSICADDLGGAVASFADDIRELFPAVCYWGCAVDSDPTSPGVQPSCEVHQHVPQVGSRPLLECAKEESGAYRWVDGDYVQPSGETELCYALRTDASGATATTHDDLATECSESGLNVEVTLARRPGTLSANALIEVECVPSADYLEDCPDP